MEKYSRVGNLVGVGLIVAGLALWALIMIKGPGTDADPAASESAADNSIGSVGNTGSDPLPPGTLPTIVERGRNEVRQAYEFASDEKNHEVLKALTCYCGCTRRGHTDLLNCYIKEIKEDGKILFESHAIGCSTCLNEAVDTENWVDQGKSKARIKELIDERYGPGRSSSSSPDY